MTDNSRGQAPPPSPPDPQPIYDLGDPTTVEFWEASGRGEVIVQRCTSCGRHQLYPRPFCVACQGEVEWVKATGKGTVYSQTTVMIKSSPDHDPPYTVALVQLDEGPRLLGRVRGESQIGGRVSVVWRERDGLPPIWEFAPAAG